MATDQSTIEYLLDQLTNLQHIRSRKMFGEYALYYQDKVVGFVCDNTLLMKITDPGKLFVKDNYREGYPYPGAKPYMLISGDLWEDKKFLEELVVLTAKTIPLPKIKKTSKK